MTGGAPVRESVEAFATLRARLSDPFADRAAVLAEGGLDERAYSSIEAEWCGRFAAGDAAALALAQAFGEAYSAALAGPEDSGSARAAVSHGEAFAAAGAAPDVGMRGVVPPAAAEESGSASMPASQALEVPSFLKEVKPAAAVGAFQAPPPSMAVPPEPPAASMAVPQSLAGASMAVPPSPGAPESGGSSFTGTAEVDLAALFKKSVPFHPGAPGQAASAAQPAGAASKPAVAPPSPPAASAASGVSSPAPKPASDFSGETAEVDIAAIARKVLAFGPGRPAPASPGAPASPVAATPSAPAASASPSPTGPRAVSAPVAATPPAAQPAFTVDQYAVLSAEVALVGNDPAARGAVFQRFGVTNPDALLAEWRARLTADPALGGRWSAAYAHHYARLRTERGTPGGPRRAGGR